MKKSISKFFGLFTNTTQWFIFGFCVIIFCISLFHTDVVETAGGGTQYVPNIITYQGKILEDGASVTTTKAFGFLIYDAAAGGNLLYTASGTLISTSTVNITPSQGIFSVDMGGAGTNSLTSSTFSDNTNIYLEVWVGETKLTPRKQLTAAPFALNSQFLLGLSPTTTSSGVYIPHSDLNGNFTFTGTPQSSSVDGGLLYINPGSAADEQTLFGIGVAGAEKFRVDEDGDVWIGSSATVANSLQVTNLTVTGTTSMNTTTINADLNVKNGLESAFYVDRLNLRVGVASSSPGFPLSVTGQSYFSATSTIQDINVLDGIVLGGVKRTSWPAGGAGDAVLAADNTFTGQNSFTNTSTIQNLVINDGIVLGGVLRTTWPAGGGDVTAAGDNSFTGLNTFSATSTFTSTTISGQLNVDSGTFLVDSINNRVGVSTSSPAFSFSVDDRSYFGATSTFRGPTTIQGRTQNPYILGHYFLPNTGAGVTVRGKYAYVTSDSNNSLEIVDISDPSSPSFVSRISDGDGGAELSGAMGIFLSGNYAYVTASTGDALEIVDVSNPKLPTHAGKILTSTSAALVAPVNVVVSGNYAYVASFGSDALEVVDVSNPRSPRHAGKYIDTIGNVLNGAQNLYIAGHYAYVVAANADLLAIIDISQPEDPKLISTLANGSGGALLDYPTGVFVTGKYALIASYMSSALEIVDISNAKAPTHFSSLSNGSGGALLNNPTIVFATGKYAYVASYTSDALEVVDISTPSNPRHVAAISDAFLDGPQSVYVANNTAYLANYIGTTLTMVDVSGAILDNATIDNATIGSLNVSDNVDIQGGASVNSGLNVGNGLLVGGDISLYSPTSTTYATSTINFSNTARFFSSVPLASQNNVFIFDTVNTFPATVSSSYLLSVRNNGLKAFSVASNGDVAASGTLYASNALIGTPGSPGDLAERVDIAVDDTVEPGDVVIVDSENEDTYRRSRTSYEQGVAGVISTQPSLVIGFGKTQNTAVLAMVGRVPIKVSTENGPIRRGDVLVTSATPGYAMRYDSSKDDDTKIVGIIGVALDSFDSDKGKIMGLVRTGWVNSRHKTIADIQQELTDLVEAQSAQQASNNLQVTEVNGQLSFLSNDLDATGHSIFNVKSLVAKDGRWEVDEDGRFVTRLDTSDGRKSLYSLQSGDTEFVFSGSSQLIAGSARVDFDAINREIIDGEKPMKINITLTSEANGVYVSGKDPSGFVVKELQNGASNASFDYVVIATRKTQEALSASVNNVTPPTPREEVPPVEEVVPVEVDPVLEESGVTASSTPSQEVVPVVEEAPVAEQPVSVDESVSADESVPVESAAP